MAGKIFAAAKMNEGIFVLTRLKEQCLKIFCEYVREFLKKIEMTLNLVSGTWGKMFHEKNLKQKKSRDTIL
jgi:hypothetical protein